jgi:hypothetical protein
MQLTTDGHKAYLEAVEEAFGADINYAIPVKMSVSRKASSESGCWATCLASQCTPLAGARQRSPATTVEVSREAKKRTITQGAAKFEADVLDRWTKLFAAFEAT